MEFFNTPHPALNLALERAYRHRGPLGDGSLRELSEAIDAVVALLDATPTAQAAPAAGAVAGPTVDLPKLGVVPAHMASHPGILALMRMVQSISIVNKMACWDHLAMFDVRDALCAAAPTPAAQAADSVLEDAARWRAWAAGMVEACAAPHGVTPPFMAAFEEAVGDSDASFSVEQLNGWVDAARKQEGA